MKRNLRLFLLLYLAGFGAGILAANLLTRKTGYQTSLLSVYLAGTPSGENSLLFGNLLFRRGGFFFVGAVCGVTVLGFFLMSLSLLWEGFMGGNVMALFLTELGIKGMGIGMLCMFPQILFYIPGWFLYFFAVMQMSQKSFAGRRRKKEDYQAYFFFLSIAGALLILGIWTESYANQKILCYILENYL